MYISIIVIYKDKRFKAQVLKDITVSELKREALKHLGLSNAVISEYRVVAKTHMSLVKDSEWELMEKEVMPKLRDWSEW